MINTPTQQTCYHETIGFQQSFEHPSMLHLMVSGDKNGARPHHDHKLQGKLCFRFEMWPKKPFP